MQATFKSDYVVGIDEAGRGPWAGPMTASAVVLKAGTKVKGVKDSKKMTDASREAVVDTIWDTALYYVTQSVSSEVIDQMGVGKAWIHLISSLLENVYEKYPGLPGVIDGNQKVPGFRNVQAIPKADDFFPAVSAASVLAKYMQTCCMDGYHALYPAYGFLDHRGYGTASHMAALERHGVCPIHRKSFRPIKQILSRSAGSSRD